MQDGKLTVVMYHYVRDLRNSRYPGIKGCDVESFRGQIDFLKRHYRFVTIEEVIAAYNGEAILPDHPVLLTFDDAYKDHFDYVFPILEQKHIQGAFYPPVKAVTEHVVLDVNKIHFILASTPEKQIGRLLSKTRDLLDSFREEYDLKEYDYYFNKLAVANRFDCKEVIFFKRLLQVELDESLRRRMTDILFQEIVGIDEGAFSRELYMSVDQLKCMVDCGMHIGSHGYDHYWLSSLSLEKQAFEILKSKEFIAMVGGDPDNWTICYPYGDYNDVTIQTLKGSGCRLGLTTRVGLADVSANNSEEVFKLPRLDVNDLPKEASASVNKWYE